MKEPLVKTKWQTPLLGIYINVTQRFNLSTRQCVSEEDEEAAEALTEIAQDEHKDDLALPLATNPAHWEREKEL